VCSAGLFPCLLQGRLELSIVPGDDEKPPHPAERGNDVLDDPVGEVLLFRIAADVAEGQYRDRRFRRRKRRRLGRGGGSAAGLATEGVNPDGTSDVFQCLLAAVVPGKRELAVQLIVDFGGDEDASRSG
jgi:hypothetical protein